MCLVGASVGTAWGQTLPPIAAPAALTLPEAVTEALATNPAGRAAQQQFAQAQARLQQAQAGRRFQITFNSTAGGSSADVIQPPPSHETFGTLQNTLTVPLPVGTRPGLAVRQAQDLLTAAQAQYDSARLALAGQVGAAYYDLLRKQALTQVAQEALDQAQRQLTEAQKRNGAGDVAQLDVIRAQVPVTAAQAQLDGAENDEAVARQTLNSLIGQDLDAPLAIAPVTPDGTAPPLTLEQARAQALQFSPDVRAADATARAAQAALEFARRFREPTFSLQAIDIRSGDQTSFSREDTIQAAVTIPLTDGGLGRAQVRESQAILAQAQAQAQTARRTVLTTVSAAYVTVQSARRRVTDAQSARDIAQVSYDKTVLGYQNGLFPLTDVLNAQAALTQARLAYTQAIYDAAIAVGSLNAALNGGVLSGVVAPGGPSPAGPATGMIEPAAPAAGNGTAGNNAGGAAGGRGGP